MKPKKLLFSALMFFAVLNSANAQIEQEIKSFVDTIEILVNNGRQMMLQSVQTGNFERVTEIYEFLNERTQINNCVAFSHREMLHIALLTSNWDEFFTRAANPFITHFRHNQRVNTKVFCQSWSYRDHLGTTLRTQVEDNSSQILERALMADLTPEQKDLLQLFFHLIEHGADEIYSRKLRTFRRRYPQSEYSEFVKELLPSGIYRGGLALSMGATQVFPTGGLSHYFNPATVFNASWDFNFNRLFFGFQVNAGNMRLNTPLLSCDTGYDYDFQINERFHYLDWGFPIGYILIRSNRFELSPFVNIGGTVLRSNLYDAEDRDLEFRVVNSLTVGSGLRSEFRLFQHTGEILFHKINLRLDVGYNIPVVYRFTPAKGNIPYVRLALVWWFGEFN
jgi:hypothetical protein